MNTKRHRPQSLKYKLQSPLTYQSKTVSLTRSHMEGNYRKHKKKQVKKRLTFIHDVYFYTFVLLGSSSYLYLEVQHLVPLGVCVLLNDLSAQLEIRKKHTSAFLLLMLYPECLHLTPQLRRDKTIGNLFASEASLQEGIHQVLLVFIPSKYFFHALDECIIHCNEKKVGRIEYSVLTCIAFISFGSQKMGNN